MLSIRRAQLALRIYAYYFLITCISYLHRQYPTAILTTQSFLTTYIQQNPYFFLRTRNVASSRLTNRIRIFHSFRRSQGVITGLRRVQVTSLALDDHLFSTNPTIRLRVFCPFVPSVVVARSAHTHPQENSWNEKKRRKTFPSRFRFLPFFASRLAINLDKRSSLVPVRRTNVIPLLVFRTSFEITIRARRPLATTLETRQRRSSTDERTLRRYRHDGRSV